VAVRGQGLPDLWAPRPGGARLAGVAAAIAVGLHGLLALAVVTIDPARFRSETPIEIDVDEKLPPPEIKPPPPEPPPPPPEPRPRIVHKMPTVVPHPSPPPPSEQPAKPDEPPPSFGVSMDSTVGESSVAVPVGQTLMTKPAVKKEPPKPIPSGDGTAGFTPVADIYLSKHADVISCPNGEEFYPIEAKRLGIEGVVDVKLGIDQNGKVVQMKITQHAGHGFDEAALKAIKQCKFQAAVTNDGRSVPSNMIYRYRFESDR